MSLRSLAIAIAIGLSLPSLVTGCDIVNTRTKMANGQLYQSGEGRYDPYFAQVHQEQVAAASWADESKAARRPIVAALDLRPGASNATILSAVRDKRGDAGVGRAVEETVAAERERARRLGAQSDKLEELHKRGEELKKQVTEERRNLGAEKADPKVVAKKDELKQEIIAAVDAIESMTSDAKRGAREAEELAQKLRSTWAGKSDQEPKEDKKKSPEPVAKKTAPREPGPSKKPAARPPDKPPEDKPAKPAATKTPTDEVFNP